MRDWQAEKGGVRRGESRNGCPPPASPFVREKKLVNMQGTPTVLHTRFNTSMPTKTAFRKGICRKIERQAEIILVKTKAAAKQTFCSSLALKATVICRCANGCGCASSSPEASDGAGASPEPVPEPFLPDRSSAMIYL